MLADSFEKSLPICLCVKMLPQSGFPALNPGDKKF
jgi:hypothetical protein